MMKDLMSSIEELALLLQEHCAAPHWARILIIEDTHCRYEDQGKVSLSRPQLKTIEEYARRFDELLNAGHSWINLHAEGIVDGALIVVVEKPNYPNTCPPGRASINLSGPERRVQQNGWNLAPFARFVDGKDEEI